MSSNRLKRVFELGGIASSRTARWSFWGGSIAFGWFAALYVSSRLRSGDDPLRSPADPSVSGLIWLAVPLLFAVAGGCALFTRTGKTVLADLEAEGAGRRSVLHWAKALAASGAVASLLFLVVVLLLHAAGQDAAADLVLSRHSTRLLAALWAVAFLPVCRICK